ncbi:MAG: LacI family DNA-binding transcriptional regulator [Geminicoccaceae bacterium]
MDLKSLSRHLGLSQTTVSRALNGYPEVSEKTRARVVAAARQLGYRPNPIAKRLATGRTELVGIIYPPRANPLIDPYFQAFVSGIGDHMETAGIDVVIGLATSKTELISYRRFVGGGRVDGLIVAEMRRRDERVAYLAKSGMPFVAHGRTDVDADYAWLDIDNEGGFFAATEHLIRLGHRRVAFLNGLPEFTFASHRFAGYRNAHRKAGLKLSSDLVISGPMTEEWGFAEARRLFLKAAPPTAILCAGIFTAKGVYRAIAESGLSVPRDVSIISHDDHVEGFGPNDLSPALTTVDQPLRNAGRQIARMLLERVNGKPIDELQVLWSTSLIVRASTASPG